MTQELQSRDELVNRALFGREEGEALSYVHQQRLGVRGPLFCAASGGREMIATHYASASLQEYDRIMKN